MKRLLTLLVVAIGLGVLCLTSEPMPARAMISLNGGAAKEYLFKQGIYQTIAADLAELGLQAGRFGLSSRVQGKDGTLADLFGLSVAIDGDSAVIGASQASVDGVIRRGAAYVFVRRGAEWVQQQKLSADDPAEGDQFGKSVAISGDSAIIGDPNADIDGKVNQGAAYIFLREGGIWRQQAKLVAGDGVGGDAFGSDVDISGDTALVGADIAKVNGIQYQGAAYVFVRNGNAWTPQQKLTANDGNFTALFGYSVALSRNTAIINAQAHGANGEPNKAAAYVFVREGVTWVEQQKLVPSDGNVTNQSIVVAVDINEDTAVIGVGQATIDGSNNQGAAYVFVRDGSVWTEQQKLMASDGKAGDTFGYQVALDGDIVTLSAQYATVTGDVYRGSAYVFVRSASTWHQQDKFVSADGQAHELYASSLAIDGNTILVGVPQSDDFRKPILGKAYFYERTALALSKSYSPDQIAPGSLEQITSRVTVTTGVGTAAVTVTDTVASGLNIVPNSWTSDHGILELVPSNPPQIVWTGFISPDLPVTIQYQVTLAPEVEPGSLLGSQAVAEAVAGETYSVQASVATQDIAFRGALMLIYIAADTAQDGALGSQGNLANDALRLVNQAERSANLAGVRTIVMLDGPAPDDARVYNLKYDTDLSCPNFQNLYCSNRPIPYIEGKNTFKWGDAVANPTSLAEFVIGALRANPSAETVLLSLVGHGGGWSPDLFNGQPTKYGGQPTKYGGQPTNRSGQPEDEVARLSGGLLWDMHYADALSTAGLATALQMIKDAPGGRKIDLLYLDACLMAMSEVAYEVRNGAGFLLASQSWTWTAFPYDKHIQAAGRIITEPGDQTTKTQRIGEAWLANNVAALSEDDNYPFTYSLTDLGKMPALLSAQNALADTLIDALASAPDPSRANLEAAFGAADCVDSDMDGRIEHSPGTGWVDNYCDLGMFADAVAREFSNVKSVADAARQLTQTLSATIVSSKFKSGVPHLYDDLPWIWSGLRGLTIYLPLREDQWKRRYYANLFLPSIVDSHWPDLLAAFWQTPPDPVQHPDPTCPPDGCSLPPAPQLPLELSVKITRASLGLSVAWWTNASQLPLAKFTIQRLLPPLPTRPVIVATIPYSAQPQPFVYLDTTASGSFEYCYQVIADGASTGTLAVSNFDCGVVNEPQLPSLPAPRVAAADTGILVSWRALQAATTGSLVGGYRVYRAENGGEPLPRPQLLVQETQYLDTAVVPGVEYCYMVHVLGIGGELVGKFEEACMDIANPPSYLFLPTLMNSALAGESQP